MPDNVIQLPRPRRQLLALVVRMWHEAAPDDDIVAAAVRLHRGVTTEELNRAFDDARPYIGGPVAYAYYHGAGGGGEAA